MNFWKYNIEINLSNISPIKIDKKILDNSEYTLDEAKELMYKWAKEGVYIEDDRIFFPPHRINSIKLIPIKKD